MKLYDQKIQEILDLTGVHTQGIDTLHALPAWPRVDKEELILKFDMATELGGGTHHAVSGLAYTTSTELVKESGIVVICGEDSAVKNQCNADGRIASAIVPWPKLSACDYGKFVLIRLKEEMDQKDKQELYARFRKLDYLRYHLFLKGVSARISSVAHREVVRISREAVDSGITFHAMGKTWLEAYLKMEEVAAVQIFYYVNAGDASYYKKLAQLAADCEKITESLNVIFQGVSMDCNTCGQKAVCDAVEGLREMHEELLK